jgi:hypothetical protein
MKILVSQGLILLIIFVAISCKKEGCTDASATNYDSEAKKDDGSCQYPVDPRDEFIGSYSVTDSAFGSGGSTFVSASTYSITISKDAASATELDFLNIWNDGLTHNATLTGSSFNLPSQAKGDGDPYNISGSGSFGTNSISFTMHSGPGGNFINEITGTK